KTPLKMLRNTLFHIGMPVSTAREANITASWPRPAMLTKPAARLLKEEKHLRTNVPLAYQARTAYSLVSGPRFFDSLGDCLWIVGKVIHADRHLGVVFRDDWYRSCSSIA